MIIINTHRMGVLIAGGTFPLTAYIQVTRAAKVSCLGQPYSFEGTMSEFGMGMRGGL